MSAHTHKKAILALLTASFIWGLSPPIIKYTLGHITPELYLFLRFFITCLVLFPIFIIKIKNRFIPNSDILRYAILGFLSTPLNLLLFFAGINQTTANDSTLISIISPILIIAGGAFFLKETVTKREKIGIGIVCIGTLLTIIQPFFETNLIGPKGNLYGNVLVFLGTLAGAGYVLLYKRKSYRHLDPFILTCISFFVGLFAIYPILLLTDQTLIPNHHAWPGIIFMAIFGSALAYSFHNYGISKIEVSEASLFTYLQPVIAVPLSVIFLKEPLTPIFIIGSLFIITGLLVAETRKA